jgi:glutathione synthase/RimK-type ligase-like ATP-grasp enzyme
MEKQKLWFLPYNGASEGLKNLSYALQQLIEVKYIVPDPEKSKFKGSKNKTVVNWGNSTLPPHVDGANLLNHPNALRNITHKLRFFQAFKDAARLPEFTRSRDEAAGWAPEGKTKQLVPFAMARTVLQGHSGEGIVELFDRDDLKKIEEGVLITRYVPKKSEWRLHISGKDGIFFIQKKVRRNEVEEPNWRIRSFENGFNFANGEEYVREVPQDVKDQAEKLFKATGLDFGAVDVIYNQRHDQAYVLEVNSAPGLTGTTVEMYAKMIQNLIK